jgi:hypothetical protein
MKFRGGSAFAEIKLELLLTCPDCWATLKAKCEPSLSDMHFFVDNATSVPQYLVCKHSTAQRVGLQSEIGLQKATKSS